MGTVIKFDPIWDDLAEEEDGSWEIEDGSPMDWSARGSREVRFRG